MSDLVNKLFNELKTAVTSVDELKQKMAYLEQQLSAPQVQPSLKRSFNKWVRDIITKAPSGMDEDVDAEGGYFVPAEFKAQVIYTIEQYGIARKVCTVIPFASDNLTIPSVTTSVSIAWPGEGTAPSYTKPVLSNVTMAVKKMMALIPVTNELLADSAINVNSLLLKLIGEAVACEEDRLVLAGNTGAGDAFSGVLTDATNIKTMDSGDTTFVKVNSDYLSDMISQTPTKYQAGCKFYLHRTLLNVIRKLKDDEGRYIWQSPSEGAPGTIWGYPYITHEQMPSTSTSSQPGKAFIIFGNLKYVYFGDREKMSIDSTPHYLFSTDEILLRYKERISIKVAEPGGICILKTAAS